MGDVHITFCHATERLPEPCPEAWGASVLTDCCLRRVPSADAVAIFYDLPPVNSEEDIVIDHYLGPPPPKIKCAEGKGCNLSSAFARGKAGREAMGIGNYWESPE